jgi:GNAT superfamily N-acetyltransferase
VVKIDIQGLTDTKKLLSELPTKLRGLVDAEIEEGARDFVFRAQTDAPVDTGRLKGAIAYKKIGDLDYEIFSQSAAAAYMEFGTKGNYRPVPGAEQIAARFRGKGEGSFKDMVRAIIEWVRRKGIAGRYSVKTRRRVGNKNKQQQENIAAAWPIIMSIMKNGVKAHPYFFKQQGIVVPKMIERINRALDNLL